MKFEEFLKNPIKHFQGIMKMKPEEAAAMFEKLNNELAILIALKKQETAGKEEPSEPPKEYSIPPENWI